MASPLSPARASGQDDRCHATVNSPHRARPFACILQMRGLSSRGEVAVLLREGLLAHQCATKPSSPIMRQLFLATAALLVAGCVHPSSLTTAQPMPRDGTELVTRMHDRYAGRWYNTVTFTQTTTQHLPDGTERVSTWHEAVRAPGILRIDVGAAADGNVIIYSRDSSYGVRGGEARSRRARREPVHAVRRHDEPRSGRRPGGRGSSANSTPTFAPTSTTRLGLDPDRRPGRRAGRGSRHRGGRADPGPLRREDGARRQARQHHAGDHPRVRHHRAGDDRGLGV